MASRSLLPSGFDLRNAAHKLAVAMIVASVVCALLGEYGLVYLLFTPAFVLDRFYVWQLATSLLIARNPMEVIFGFIIIYSCGSNLVYFLGEKRFLRLVLGIPFVSMCLTLLLSLVIPTLQMIPNAGAAVLITVVWIAYGLAAWFSGGMLNFWGIPVTGLNFAYIGVGFVVLNGVFSSFLLVVPEIFACALTFLYFQKRDQDGESIFQKVELWYYNWKLKRLKAKRGFKVVEGEGRKPPTDRQLH